MIELRNRSWVNTLVLLGALLGGVFSSTAVMAEAQVQAQKMPALSPPPKIGFVSTERILRESGPAKAAQTKIEKEFKKRDDELQRLAKTLRTQVAQFDKDAPVQSESERVKRQRELSAMDVDLQRRRREFQEDFNRRRNEEFSSIAEKAGVAIKHIAEQEHYDLILQDAVTVSPRVDITDRVIQSLDK
jgi:outer membrane protein